MMIRPVLLALLLASQAVRAGTLTEIDNSVVDPAALTLPASAPYGSAINGLAFQQDIVHTSHGWQYAAYYDGQRHPCIARRRLPDDPWQVIRFEDYRINQNDAHNVICLGICERDGTIHLAFDQHSSPLHYRVSRTGVASHPELVSWQAGLFGSTRSSLGGPDLLQVTYPCFWNTPDGGLQLNYRLGISGLGDNWLADYSPALGLWSRSRQIDSGRGIFRDELGTSPTRNAYANGYDYDETGRLHETWTWRESAIGTNHDLLYAYSDDRGFTWNTDAGEEIPGPARVDTLGLAVVAISRRQGLMNTQAQAVDHQNQMHVVMWSSLEPVGTLKGSAVWGVPAERRYHHYWREGPSRWHDDVLPWVAGSRPKLFVDDKDNLLLIYNRALPDESMPDGLYYQRGDLVVAGATAAANWQDWKILAVKAGPFLNEMLGDPTRWASQKILSIVVQQTPAQLGQPSPLRVIDYQWMSTPGK